MTEAAADTRRLHPLMRMLVLGLVYAAVLRLGMLAVRAYPDAASFWPATGVALWILLSWGPAMLPALTISALVVAGSQSGYSAAGVALGAVNVVEALLGWWLLARVLPFDRRLSRLRDVGLFLLAAGFSAPIVGATLALGVKLALGLMPSAGAGGFWERWAAGDGLGALVVGVALLAWSQSEHRVTRPTRTYAIETVLVALGVIVLLLRLLGGAASTTHPLLVQMFFMFPFVIWSGLRLGLRTTSTLIVVFTCVSVAVAAMHGDVLRMGEARESLEVLQLFIGVLAVMGLVIATVTREHRRAHAEMCATLSLLEATLDSTADGILVVDSGGVQTRANRRFVELWGIPGEVLATRDDARILAFVLDQLADPGVFLARVEALYSRPEDESFDEVHFKDGRILERYSMPQREHGRVVGRVWSFRDVTRQRRLEHDLRQTHKMEAVGRLAGGVAHDFNNLLTVVIGHCGLLLSSVKGSPAARAEVEAITIAARRAAELTRQLLAFSRRQVLTPQRLDLNQVMQETAVMLAGVLGGDIALRLQPSPGLGAVNVDPGQIQQVLLNLVLNARDAMPQGGVIVLGTGEVTRAESAPDSLALPPGRYVVLTVSDTGVGMDDLTRAHLFEPFYTTKGFGRGTGLGLATVYGIVRQSGGDIAVVSAPGRGTEFRILLPRMEAPATAAPSLMPESLPRGNGTLLLVEDDASVRDFMAEALRQAGYDVRVACEGGEALRVAEGLDGTLDVLVTDIVMPGMGGTELAVRLRERHPGIPVLFVSGYADEFHQGGVDGVCGGRYLQKPFTPDVLVRMVGETLGSRAKAA